MRALLVPTAALAMTLALSANASAAGAPPPVLTKPLSEENLRTLDDAQLRLLRRAIRTCRVGRAPLPGGRTIADERDPCVISSTDHAVADANDPDLLAFHNALPDGARYDENRPTTVWRAWVQAQTPQ